MSKKPLPPDSPYLPRGSCLNYWVIDITNNIKSIVCLHHTKYWGQRSELNRNILCHQRANCLGWWPDIQQSIIWRDLLLLLQLCYKLERRTSKVPVALKNIACLVWTRSPWSSNFHAWNHLCVCMFSVNSAWCCLRTSWVFCFSNRSIIGLQYSVSFCWTTAWIGHKDAYIPSFLGVPPPGIPPVWVITVHCTELPML